MEPTPAAGLSSPSKRRPGSVQRKVSSAWVKPVRPSLQSPDGRKISDRSRVSLSTMGGRQMSSESVRRSMESTESKDRSRATTSPVEKVPAAPPPTPQAHARARGRSRLRTSHASLSSVGSSAMEDGGRVPPTPTQTTSGRQGPEDDSPWGARRRTDLMSHPNDSRTVFSWHASSEPQPETRGSSSYSAHARTKGHRRQKGTQLSSTGPVEFSSVAKLAMPERRIEDQATSPPARAATPRLGGPHGARPLPRPPSIAIFDPQISPGRGGRSKQVEENQNVPYSPTLSIFNYYNSPHRRATLEEESFARQHGPSRPRSSTSSIFSSTAASRPPSSISISTDVLAAFPSVPKQEPATPPRTAWSMQDPTSVAVSTAPLSARRLKPVQVLISHAAAERSPRGGPPSKIRGPRTPPFRRFPRKRATESDGIGSQLDGRRQDSDTLSEPFGAAGSENHVQGQGRGGGRYAIARLPWSGHADRDRLGGPAIGTPETGSPSAKRSGKAFSSSLTASAAAAAAAAASSSSASTPGRALAGLAGTATARPRQVLAVRDSRNFAMPIPRAATMRNPVTDKVVEDISPSSTPRSRTASVSFSSSSIPNPFSLRVAASDAGRRRGDSGTSGVAAGPGRGSIFDVNIGRYSPKGHRRIEELYDQDGFLR